MTRQARLTLSSFLPEGQSSLWFTIDNNVLTQTERWLNVGPGYQIYYVYVGFRSVVVEV